MSESPNPYRPPAPLSKPPTRKWSIWRLFRRHPRILEIGVRWSELSIVEGIAFFVDPNDSSVAIAVSPSAITTDDRMELVTSEATRVLPELFLRRRSFRNLIHGQKMTVRLVESYAEAKTSVRREHSVTWDEMVKQLPQLESL
ncbi:hypothetical protein [Aporhodopirellula aestuarii]|uniref:Uncharacterized protein n=1 Tax=Aporhodopirellula aestuarii TaxID=2950107 RepID=A0ABT0UA26_9BACT|nr:hypothetical protein [Aporhodopirellula aestuarii]MCM2373849.1 hypothetical protein [Aporhodopirellula aestuarii]